jgi:ferric-dicitrate binding protein FerR (iron transport regulator)
MKNYTEYTDTDFVMDTEFHEWVKNPSHESELFWTKFLRDNPHKRVAIDRAKALLRSMVFKQNLLPSEKEAMWQEIRTAMRRQEEGKLVFMKTGRTLFTKKMAYGVAAMVSGCALFLSVYYFTEKTSRQVVATKYGEIRKLILPDSSSITLNANSAVKYADQWSNSKDREVWIDGEAFFSIKHTKDNQRFIVHTNEVDIEVLGTEFNVMERDKKVKVSLNSGRIKLQAHQSPNTLFMLPGDILEVDANNIHKAPGKVENLSLWKENKLVFDDTPLGEILIRLKHIYGWEFANVQNDILDEKLTGEVETKDEKELLRTLEKALRIKITKEGNTVYISRL